MSDLSWLKSSISFYCCWMLFFVTQMALPWELNSHRTSTFSKRQGICSIRLLTKYCNPNVYICTAVSPLINLRSARLNERSETKAVAYHFWKRKVVLALSLCCLIRLYLKFSVLWFKWRPSVGQCLQILKL